MQARLNKHECQQNKLKFRTQLQNYEDFSRKTKLQQQLTIATEY